MHKRRFKYMCHKDPNTSKDLSKITFGWTQNLNRPFINVDILRCGHQVNVLSMFYLGHCLLEYMSFSHDVLHEWEKKRFNNCFLYKIKH